MDCFIEGLGPALTHTHAHGRPALPAFTLPPLPTLHDGAALSVYGRGGEGQRATAAAEAALDAADALSVAHLQDLHRRLQPPAAPRPSPSHPTPTPSLWIGPRTTSGTTSDGADALATAYEVDETAALIAQHIAVLDALQVRIALPLNPCFASMMLFV